MAVKQSEELIFLMSTPPKWFIRSGLLLLFLLLFVGLLFAYYIRFPDTISAEVKILAVNPRVRVVAKSTGSIHFSAPRNSKVLKGQILGTIKSSSVLDENIIFLDSTIEAAKRDINSLYDPKVLFDEGMFFADLQEYYDNFLRKRRLFLLHHALANNKRKIKQLKIKLSLLGRLEKNRNETKKISEIKLTGEEERFYANSKLFDVDLLNKSDFLDAKNVLLDNQHKLGLENQELEQLKITKTDIISEIENLTAVDIESESSLRADLLDSFKLLYSKVKAWADLHQLIAPCAGRVYYDSYFSNGMFIQEREEVFSILPKNESLFAVAKIPFSGSGDIETGSAVNISLDSYVSEKYGIIRGRVKSFTPVPITGEDAYQIIVSLPDGLKTSYRRSIPYSPELKGRAEIIIKNTTLLQKVFYKIRQITVYN